MTDKLKTLEDMEYLAGSLTGFKPGTKAVFSKKLRAEAIKHYNDHTNGSEADIQVADWIKHFFNLTEADIKPNNTNK